MDGQGFRVVDQNLLEIQATVGLRFRS